MEKSELDHIKRIVTTVPRGMEKEAWNAALEIAAQIADDSGNDLTADKIRKEKIK